MLTATRHVTVRALPDEHAAVARTLARSFYDDPVFAWMFPDASTRLARNERVFSRIVLRMAAPHDQIHTVRDHAGAALWFPPGTADTGLLAQLRLMPAMVWAARRDLPRVLRCMTLMEDVHPHEPHWYLNILGTDPDRQGEGIGTALLRTVLDRSDEDGTPAYLEATSPRNRALYERHGFEVTGEIRLPDGPAMWPMWREAQA